VPRPETTAAVSALLSPEPTSASARLLRPGWTPIEPSTPPQTGAHLAVLTLHWGGRGWEDESRPYLVALPPVRDIRPQFLITHDLPHLLDRRIGGYEVVVGKLILFVDTWKAEQGKCSSWEDGPSPRRSLQADWRWLGLRDSLPRRVNTLHWFRTQTKKLGFEFTRKIQGNQTQLPKLEQSQRAAINASQPGGSVVEPRRSRRQRDRRTRHGAALLPAPGCARTLLSTDLGGTKSLAKRAPSLP